MPNVDPNVKALGSRILELATIVLTNEDSTEMVPMAQTSGFSGEVDQAIVLTTWILKTVMEMAVEENISVMAALQEFAQGHALLE